jgi:hypothetical protein
LWAVLCSSFSSPSTGIFALVTLVTGVFQGPGANCQLDTAALSVADVEAAVDAALHRARATRWHSMR